VLRTVIAVYSVHPTAPLTLAARVAGFDREAYRTLGLRFGAVRVPAMRTCGFLVPRETLQKVWPATRKPPSKHAWRLREAGITPRQYARLRDRVLSHLADAPRSTRQLRVEKGLAQAPLSPVLQMMAFEGSLVSLAPESLRSNEARYLTTGAALGGPMPEDEARAVFERLRSAHPLDVDDVAKLYVEKLRAAPDGRTILAAAKADGLHRLLMEVMEAGWTSGRERTAIDFLGSL